MAAFDAASSAQAQAAEPSWDLPLVSPPPSATAAAVAGEDDLSTSEAVAVSREAAVARLAEMGFAEERCRAALHSCDMDEHRALDSLLMSGE